MRAQRRVGVAILATLLWLAGVEVLPNLHLALHELLAPHVHEGDAAAFAGHRHADGSVHREVRVVGGGVRVEKRRHPHDPHAERELALRLEHGAHSLAHRGVAMQPAPYALVAPLPIVRRPLPAAEIAITEPSSRVVSRAKARGPPPSPSVG